MINAKKSLGQNFLKDENVINNIVNSINVEKDDLIVEIGPGKGSLTKKLKNKKANLLAFEIDTRMKEILSPLEDDKTKIIYEDVLKVNITDYIDYNYKNKYVIANLPYYITSPIVQMLLSIDIFNEMTLMVQKEVADRFSANPHTKDYGMITVLINSKYNVEKLFIVKSTCFDPSPKVDSCVIKLSRKNKNIKINFDNLKKITSLSFMHKRKTLKNNLPANVWKQVLPYLKNKGYNENVRAEEIDVDTYIQLSNNINL